MNNLHIIDIAVIAMYLIACLVIGLYKAGNIRTIREYTLGTGYISTTVLFFTLFATHIGAGSTVGAVEGIYSMGLIFVISVLAGPLLWLITAKVFARNIDLFKKAGCMSVSDIMGFLYGKPGKWITNILAIFVSVAVIALQIGAIGYLFNYFLGIPQSLGILVGFGVLVTYSVFGGIRAVALTDAFQGLVILVAIPLACSIALHDVGGYAMLVAQLPATHLFVDFTKSNILLLASLLFFALLPESVGTFMQRFLMANDSKQLTKTLTILSCISVPFALVICLIGFIVKVKAPEIAPSAAFFYMIGNYLPVGITGLLISGILAAIMSTADSWLNTTSVLCAHDIAKGLFPNLTDKQELLIARISVLVISALSVTLALATTSLIALEWLSGNFWVPVISVPIIAGFMMFQTNSRSFISSATLAVTGVFLGKYITGDFSTISILLGTIGSSVGLFGMHYFQVYTGRQVGEDIFSQYAKLSTSAPKRTNLFAYITKLIKKQTSKHREYCHLLGGLGIIYFLGSSFFMEEFTYGTVVRTVVYMKAVAAVLCFGLCVYDHYLPQKQQARYMPMYWYITLLYCFPFLSSYIALVYGGSMPWMINLMLSSILLYVFGGLFTMIFLSIVGFLAAYALFKLTGYSLAVIPNGDPKMLSYVYCILTAGIVIVLKAKDRMQERELESRKLYGAAVAHEVVNHMQGSAMIADVLLEAFKDKEQIDKKDFDEIKELLEPFKEATSTALKTVDRLLRVVKTDVAKADDMGTYKIGDCVRNALASYGLTEKAVARIHVRERNEFYFKGSNHFAGHVITNLINNAIKYAGSESKIEIWYEGNELHFRDNGVGIASEKLPYIFKAFEGSATGTGIGLPFCKYVMESMGGSIECYSELGKGTEFVLTFAKGDRKSDLELNLVTS